jgi:excisionase family DNA binding protein
MSGGQRMLTKVEAAEYLGCTTRTLERHIKDKKIGVTYQQSKYGEVAMFDPQELEDFKTGNTSTRTTRIVPAAPYEPAEFIDDSTPTEQPGNIVPTPNTQTELLNPQQPEANFSIGALIAPLGALFNNLTRAIDNHGSRVTTTELRSKLLLTLDEAQIITGLSREILLDAIKNGELPSKIMGKAYRIKTQDLERYIENLEF